MQRIVVVVWMLVGLLLPLSSAAQSPAGVSQGFVFCTVTDTSSAQAKIWASPVFELSHDPSDPAAPGRLNAVAAEFLQHITALGGTGTKECVSLPTHAEADALREQHRATWNKRMYMIKIGDWREVAWSPAARSPEAAAAAPAQITRYFYCYEVNTDVPDDLSHTVATGVFARKVPGGNPTAVYEMAADYSTQFKQQVRAQGLPERGDCTPFDTRAEAEYQQQQIFRHFKGFNMKFHEITWTPGDVAITPTTATVAPPTAALKTILPAQGLGMQLNAVNAELAKALGLPSTQGAWVLEVADGSAAMKAGIKSMDVLVEIAGQAVTAHGDVQAIINRMRPGFEAPVRVWRERRMHDLKVVVPPAQTPGQPTTAMAISPAPAATPVVAAVAPVAADAAADNGQYCTAFVMHSKEPLMLRMPVWQVPAGQASQAAMSDSVSRLITAVIQAYPAKWMAFPPVACHDNSGVFAGETFCVSNTYKHFGGSQMAALFCNRSKEMIDKRWADMVKADGDSARIFPWPVAP